MPRAASESLAAPRAALASPTTSTTPGTLQVLDRSCPIAPDPIAFGDVPPPRRFGVMYSRAPCLWSSQLRLSQLHLPPPRLPRHPAWISHCCTGCFASGPPTPWRRTGRPCDPSHSIVTRAKRGIRLSSLYKAALLSSVPRTYRAALTNPN